MESIRGKSIASFPLQSTLFFPVSANPIGFNHFAAAEWMLRSHPAWKQVVFIPSNGHHPDPKKPDPEAGREERLEILSTAITCVNDTGNSHLARLALAGGETLHIGPDTLSIWAGEFEYDRSVTTSELVALLRAARPQDKARVNWFAGSDLILRMADQSIFSGEDLQFLADNCQYAILEREDYPLQTAVQTLFQTRDVSLDYLPFSTSGIPGWLATFLSLSSTHIRHAAEAGDPLGAMLPAPAEDLIENYSLYRPARPIARLVDDTGLPRAPFSPLQLRLEEHRRELKSQALALALRLEGLHQAGKPHSLSLVETSAGGWLTVALAGHSGASRYFKQSRFAYDQQAKNNLLEFDPDNDSIPDAVSAEMVTALARGIAQQAGTDFALAESGMAGPPDGKRRSEKNGQCHFALLTPKGVHTEQIRLNPFQTRAEHQLNFATQALALTREWLAKDGY